MRRILLLSTAFAVILPQAILAGEKTDWFHKAHCGVMTHYLGGHYLRRGPRRWEEQSTRPSFLGLVGESADVGDETVQFRHLECSSALILTLTLCQPVPAAIWPGKEWATATPESQGMSSKAVDAAAEYAQRHGGGSGCIIRHGYLVRQWGDPKYRADIKSATKGSFGITCLGLAVGRGLVAIDEKAQEHYPRIGTDRRGNRKDWLADISIRHLATMSAGFDDGRPPKLYYPPGTNGHYSNDTSNMLAELLTLEFNEDLAEVIRREVMNPIGAASSDWRWRDNAYRAKNINGLKSREFASGIRITYGALARIGYLYLREGEWNGKRILSKDFIREATRPTDLPTFVPYYAFYWGSNARGTYKRMPKDTYWALGLGDSFVVVCPSLDIVAVRLGAGSRKSQLPGGNKPEDWGGRVEGFFRLVVAGVKDADSEGSGERP
jgi:CubicO group peptidase (beta-lactamase class C family)